MRHILVTVILLSACGCSPIRNLTFCVADSKSGTPIAGVHAMKITPRVSFPWSMLLWPGGIGPDSEQQVTDQEGKVRFENSDKCWYRLQADGYRDVEIGQFGVRMRSSCDRESSASVAMRSFRCGITMERLAPAEPDRNVPRDVPRSVLSTPE